MQRPSWFSVEGRALVLAWIAVGQAALGHAAAGNTSSFDALADYVRRPEDSFAWKEVERRQVEGVTAVRLEYTSQNWRSNIWRHDLFLVLPAEVRNKDIAFFSINGDGDLERQFAALRMLAERGGAIAAAINKVPNQPLCEGRKEDVLIAYTFDQYLKTGDATWPLLFPMVKSAVRGMDVTAAFAKKEFSQKLERFVVAGASKRGWTTWLSAAVDPRVKGIAPEVIDMLNMKAQTKWAQKMYGRQSDRIRAYTELHLTERMDDPQSVELREWVDPYSYRARYTLPKLILLGTNDPYWVVDSLRHYWNGLPEPKLVFQTPNAGHNLAGGREAAPTLAAFFQMVADRKPLPRMTWQFKLEATNAVSIEVKVDPRAKRFRLWTATSPDRDFRTSQWSVSELPGGSGGQVVARVEAPASGFRSYMIEAEMDAAGQSYKLSTEARVIPDGVAGEKDR
jgi:PhoPQ-activated pathogenicity-related protein